jgi:DNA-directed RNA polymerase specialized sigma24 family protein
VAPLLGSVVLPIIREVEFGLPVGKRLAHALRDREQDFRREFERQRGDLALCAQLLCTDPAMASDLLEAAWARAADAWRGPPKPELRNYVLCVFLQLLTLRDRLSGGPEPERARPFIPRSPARTAFVLTEFAGLSLAQIATMTGRSLADVANDLRAAQTELEQSGMGGG